MIEFNKYTDKFTGEEVRIAEVVGKIPYYMVSRFNKFNNISVVEMNHCDKKEFENRFELKKLKKRDEENKI
jgi:hypothetical protein